MDEIKISILYDNYVCAEGTKNDWGFSCLIEGMEKTILFDTGTKNEILLANCKKLGVDLSKPDILFLSHNHGDHTGGVKKVLELNPKLKVYVPNSLPKNFADTNGIANLIRITELQTVCEGVYSTGELGESIKEQSMIIETAKGLIVITGCSHPGIVDILKTAKEKFQKEIYLVLGGFHLLQHSNEQMINIIDCFHSLGVVKCGATHCTGETQIKMLEAAYQSDYLKMGTGRVITIDSTGVKIIR